jgi:hypothetical protein
MKEFGCHFSVAFRSRFADMNRLIHRLINKVGGIIRSAELRRRKWLSSPLLESKYENISPNRQGNKNQLALFTYHPAFRHNPVQNDPHFSIVEKKQLRCTSTIIYCSQVGHSAGLPTPINLSSLR